MKRLILFILIFITIKAEMIASNADSALVEHMSLARLTMMEGMRNPALHGAGYHTSFSQLALGLICNASHRRSFKRKERALPCPISK